MMMAKTRGLAYLCPTKINEGETCGNPLRQIMIRALESWSLSRSYLRYCDKCHSIYVLVPEWKEPKFMEIPLLAGLGLEQMEEI